MTDTRREMTRAQFAEAAAYVHDFWWLTGEDAFIHVPAVMDVEGWNFYGHPGNETLTEPQRVLMMWSDLVGQTSNGGFVQFVDNFAASLALAYRLIARLEWPDLMERFDRAFREQVGDPRDPKPRMEPWGPHDDAAVAARREELIRALVARETRWRPWARRRERAIFGNLTDTILEALHADAVKKGLVVAEDPSDAEYHDGTFEAAEAFDRWFYRDETKAASRLFVGDYIRRHRDDLCRLID